jgi:hypothetical protein
MLADILNLKNGNRIVKAGLHRCEICWDVMEPGWPRWTEGEMDFCGDCAYHYDLIDSDKYLKIFHFFYSPKNFRATKYKGQIHTTTQKRWPWEKSSKEQRQSPEYIRWRIRVFIRDNYTCQICDHRGGNLEAHHIKPYHKHHDLRHEVTNGLTLCKPCHKTQHSKKRPQL